jgi:glutathione S-transferase
MAIHVILNELNQPVQLENTALAEGKNRTPEFLKINPRGQIPVLVDGDQVIREGAAQIIYLCEKHRSPLMPTQGAARASALEWLMFCNSTLHPAYSRAFFLIKNASDDAAKEQLLSVAFANINKLWAEIEVRLQNNQYLAGNEITAADILLTVIANWSSRFPNIEIGVHTKKLLQNVSSRAAYKKALEVEQVEYKAAA